MAALSLLAGLYIALTLLRFVYRRYALRGLEMRMFFSKATAREGEHRQLTTILTNAKWLPMPWIAVRYRLSKHLRFSDAAGAKTSDHSYRHDLYTVWMHQRITRRADFRCVKRGYYQISEPQLNGWDILMDNKYIQDYSFPCATLTVYPAALPIDEIKELTNRIDGTIQAQRFLNPDPFSFRGIRDYTPQDPMKSINFKASAKTQSFMVNVRDFSIFREVVLLLNVEKHAVWHDEALDERAIRLTAGLAEQLARQHIPVRFVTNGVGVVTGEGMRIPQGAGRGQLEKILEALAHIDLTQAPSAPMADLLAQAVAHDRQDAEYWLVSTYHGPDLAAAYERLLAAGAHGAWIMPVAPKMLVDARVRNLVTEVS